MQAIAVDSPCPMCHKRGHLALFNTTVNIPYFGDALESTLRCRSCGFRHADFMILGQKDPLRLEIRIESEADLSTRVIRSNSGTVRIPELGFTAEPSTLSESYVSNVEGVLERAKEILLMAYDWHKEDPAKKALIEQYLSTWDRLAASTQPFTLIIDDPFGNSAIVSGAVARRPLSENEVAALKTGMILLDKDEVGDTGASAR